MRSQAKEKYSFILLVISAVLCLFGCENRYPDPRGLSVTAQGEKVALSWQAVDSAIDYRLFRKKGSDSDFKFLADLTQTEYTDSSVKIGEEYQYKLQAVYKNGISNGVTADCVLGTAVQDDVIEASDDFVIESVTRMDKFTAVILLENAEENARYEVLRSANAEGEFTVIGTAEGKAYYDTTADDGTQYYYKVRGQNSLDVKGVVRSIGYNSKTAVSIPVFMYHEFVTQEDIDSGVAFNEYAIWQSELEEDLIWLKANGYTPIFSKQLTDYLEGKGALPEKTVILSIDDGKYGVYKRAYPLLQKYNMKMSLAVIGNRIDIAELDPIRRGDPSAPYSTWSEIGEMSKSGLVEIISHTQNLHVFNNGDRQGANTSEKDTFDTYLPVAQRDFLRLFTKIKDITGEENFTLAYPYSKRSVLSDTVWMKCGYKLLFGGDDSKERKTLSNYFVAEAGINRDSAVMRRIPRMTGTPISEYFKQIEQNDKY